MEQGWRRTWYGSAAEESPAGHTPPEVKEAYKAKCRAWEALWDKTSDEGSDSDAKKFGERIGGKVDWGEKVAAQAAHGDCTRSTPFRHHQYPLKALQPPR